MRARDLGLRLGVLSPGVLNAITDVPGVLVGHATKYEGEAMRTGVTAIRPHAGNIYRNRVPAGVHVANGYGKAAGLMQIQELGELETPIVLTNTLALGRAVESLVDWTLSQPGNEDVRSVNAVVAETNDGVLNDIRLRGITQTDVLAALESAVGGVVEEGSVGAGTGTTAYGWKGGIGTSSRKLPQRLGGYTVGVLVQSNHGGVLTIDGLPLGVVSGRHAARGWSESPHAATGEDSGDGSIILVVATDAPLSDRNCARLAARAMAGLARTGASFANGSGDIAIAFSNALSIIRSRTPNEACPDESSLPVRELGNDDMSPLFLAAIEASEEAIINSLTMATTVESRPYGRAVRREAIDLELIRRLANSRGG
jgi:D-aminopeptidase